MMERWDGYLEEWIEYNRYKLTLETITTQCHQRVLKIARLQIKKELRKNSKKMLYKTDKVPWNYYETV